MNSTKISEMKQCNDKVYDHVAVTNIKQELLATSFLSLENKKHNGNYVDDYLRDKVGSFKTEIIFLRNKLSERNNLIKSFLPQESCATSISHKTDKNKDYHQDTLWSLIDGGLE